MPPQSLTAVEQLIVKQIGYVRGDVAGFAEKVSARLEKHDAAQAKLERKVDRLRTQMKGVLGLLGVLLSTFVFSGKGTHATAAVKAETRRSLIATEPTERVSPESPADPMTER